MECPPLCMPTSRSSGRPVSIGGIGNALAKGRRGVPGYPRQEEICWCCRPLASHPPRSATGPSRTAGEVAYRLTAVARRIAPNGGLRPHDRGLCLGPSAMQPVARYRGGGSQDALPRTNRTLLPVPLKVTYGFNYISWPQAPAGTWFLKRGRVAINVP